MLRVFQLPFGEAWEWQRDYVYRDGQLLAAVEPKADGGEARTHLHLDHLGTPRQITAENGSAVALHSYYPFGGEATDPSQDEVELKFTGHERDGNGSAGVGMLDYMHARYCSPRTGRFFSVDPVHSAIPTRPQSWNKYSYALSNPLKFRDPDGQAVETPWDAANLALGATSLLANIASGNAGGAMLDVAGLLVDGAAAATPGVPGGAATAIRAGRAARLAENARRGRQFEKAVLEALHAAKNTRRIKAPNGARTIPDLPVTQLYGVTEIKDVKNISITKQLRAQAAVAAQKGLPFNLIVSPRTESVSRPLLEAIERLGGQIFYFSADTGRFTNAAF